MCSALAPPSRRLGGELTNVSTGPGPALVGSARRPPQAAQRHQLTRIYRLHYHRQREAIVAAQIQAAEPPQNPGRFSVEGSGKGLGTSLEYAELSGLEAGLAPGGDQEWG